MKKLVLISIAILFACAMIWEGWSIQDPKIEVTHRYPPIPNAVDLYTAAAASLKDPPYMLVEAERRASGFGGASMSTAQEEALVNRNSDAFYFYRKSLDYPCLQTVSDMFQSMINVEALSSLARLDVDVKEAKGNWSEAASEIVDGIQFELNCARGGDYISFEWATYYEAGLLFKLSRCIHYLSAGQSRELAARLEGIVAHGETLREAYEYDRDYYLDYYKREFAKEDWIDHLVFPEYDSATRKPKPMQWRQWEARIIGKRRLFNSFVGYMNEIIRLAGDHYPTEWPEPPSDPLSRSRPTPHRKDYYYRVRAALLQAEIALAIHAYRLDNGQSAASLQDLVPRYLARVPDDPYAASGPMRYMLTKDHVIIYSVGPDRVDDGGKLIRPKSYGPSDKGDYGTWFVRTPQAGVPSKTPAAH